MRAADPALERQLIDFFRWNAVEPSARYTVVEKICRRCLYPFARHYRDPQTAAHARNQLEFCDHCLR